MKITNNNNTLSEFLTKSTKQLRKQECTGLMKKNKNYLLLFFIYIYIFVGIFRTTTFLTYQRTYFAVWGV